MIFSFLGGIATARKAAEFGANVAVIEKKHLGGTCVNVGCVPKKVMWNTANLADHLHDYQDYGFSLKPEDVSFSFTDIKHKRDDYVKRLNVIYRRNLDNSKVTLIEGDASFVGENLVKVGGDIIKGNKTVITVGGQPAIPDIPGVEYGITR